MLVKLETIPESGYISTMPLHLADSYTIIPYDIFLSDYEEYYSEVNVVYECEMERFTPPIGQIIDAYEDDFLDCVVMEHSAKIDLILNLADWAKKHNLVRYSATNKEIKVIMGDF